METYWRGSKKRSLRTRSVETREAVKLATQPRLELDADVGDVHLGRENRQAHGAHLAHRRGGKGEHDVQVVNHQVQHHVHIQRARREDGEPVRLEEHGAAQLRLHGQHRGIEALQVAGLQDALAPLCARDQIVGLGKTGGQRLFNQQVEARIEQC